MSRPTLRQAITGLAFATALAAPWSASAAPLAGQPSGPGLWQQIWIALYSFWDNGVTLDSGCRMDPDGRCITDTALTAADGCKMDPNGRCAASSASPDPTITPDDGCRMDPSGGCLPGS
jgi:hypothetical protein